MNVNPTPTPSIPIRGGVLREREASAQEERRGCGGIAVGPGPLRAGAWIELQTVQAQRLVRGRKPAEGQVRIVGLAGFGMRLRGIWMAARAGDPWADWWLVRVQTALGQADAALDTLVARADDLLVRPPGVSGDVAHAEHPLRVPLAFSNPYGYRAADLLAKFDGLARTLLTSVNVGLIERETGHRLVRDGGTHVRRAFLAAEGFLSRGVTRADVRDRTATALDAQARMGEVPADILDGRRRATLAPARGRESRP